MEKDACSVKVGDRVVISRPRSSSRFATTVDRSAFVTAVRPKSFDAGGLCFRNDGKEWSGHNRVCLIPEFEGEFKVAVQADPEEVLRRERTECAREDVRLAFLLSFRHEEQWLRLGLNELRRIAALHGIGIETVDATSTATANGQD
jgi:hypothetical protein